MIKVLFVCHGNICRSTMSEYVMKYLTDQAGLASEFYIDSAATSREEIGNGVHHGTRQKLKEVGIPCGNHKARQMMRRDYEEFDYIILDCPAGIEQGFKNAIAGAHRAIVVTTPEVSAIRDADRIIGLLQANEMPRIELIINRLRTDMVKRGEMMSVEDVTEILAVDLLGAVPDDEAVVIATNQGEPLCGKDSLSGKALENICRRIVGEEVPLLDFHTKKGVWKRFTGMFRK